MPPRKPNTGQMREGKVSRQSFAETIDPAAAAL